MVEMMVVNLVALKVSCLAEDLVVNLIEYSAGHLVVKKVVE